VTTTTISPTATASSDAEVELVDRRLDELLARIDPSTMTPAEMWGLQYDLGLAWVSFAEGIGGLGVHPLLQERVNARLAAAGVPSNYLHNFVGVGTAAPTIAAFGTPEQQQRLLRPLFTCEEVWCQLFSEPGAGSDLANVSTLAERDGDEWVVNGHKVWTTMAHVAKWGILVARSNPELPKHQGLTYFLVDMTLPGIEVRALRQISGEAEFNEVFFTDCRVPDSMRVGEPCSGWRVTIGTLMNERAHNGDSAKKPRGFGPIAHAVRTWRESGRDDPALRDELAQLWIEAEVLRLTALRADTTRTAGVPGPEGSVLKLAVGILPQKIMDFCVRVKGAEGMLISSYAFEQPSVMAEDRMGDGTEQIDVVKAFLNARSNTIGGGTTEMQRNTIGERVLGLPHEPRENRDVPWRDTHR
jgi:alkylation response protein AidB-like acyl-CoA dehydrogenase